MYIWLAITIFILWYYSKQSRIVSPVLENSKEVSLEKNIITEKAVFRTQTRFEKKLDEEIDFPDAIRGATIYIYRNLMRVWYQKLSSENRYNDEMTQKLRNDWLDYMSSVEDQSTYNYLSLEFYDEKDNVKSERYEEEHINASRKKFAIEDAFAAMVGKDAVNELNRIRGLTNDWGVRAFDKFGNLAPEGFEYDLNEELKPIK